MKSSLWAIILISLTSFSLKAQTTYSIKGTVVDTSANVNLENTSVSILNSKDSTLVKFTRVNAEGAFSMDNLKPGKFILLVTYPKYADYVDNFTLDSVKQSVDFGRISLLLKSKLLADVIIKGKAAAIKIKGDTTEYNAGSFTIEPNSKVEDLLRQLPGIQVDKDGKITAQGETVSKVLVDGEEFFGDDPTLVTKNIRGDMVDKVQLYDKKSDQATFTGIDDGEKTKTINIKLKEDKKKGYFGKVDAGGGNSEYYQGQGMFNAFKAKRKISAYGTIANTGKAMSWDDANKYGASSMQMSEEGYFYSNNRDDLRYNGEGIPYSQSGGVHYDAKWNKDRETVNMNYKAGGLTIEGVRSNQSQTSLRRLTADGRDSAAMFTGANSSTFRNNTFRQKLDVTYTLKIDSTSDLKVVADGTLRNTERADVDEGMNMRGNNALQNKNTRNSNNEGKNESFFGSIFYTKKLKKTGRTLSMLLSQTFNRGEDEGLVLSKNDFYDESGTFTHFENLDQLKTSNSKSSAINSNITYTEPLSKTLSLVLNYGLNLNSSSSDRKSFNKSGQGVYDIFDENFSNNFDYNQSSNQGGAVLNLKKGKNIANIGAKVNAVKLEQIDILRDDKFERNFINISPQASYQYRFSQYKGLSIRYNGSTQQPSISQIQPVRVNNNPLFISRGNPDLNPSFRNSVNVNYNSYKVLSEQYMYGYGSYSFTVNPVIGYTVTDTSKGASEYQSVNLTSKMSSNYYLNASFSRKIKSLGFTLGLSAGVDGSKNYNYIRNSDDPERILNSLTRTSYSVNLNASHYVAKKYNFNVSLGPSFNNNKSTVQSTDNSGGGFNSNGSFSVELPGKLQLSADYRYTLTKRTKTFNQDIDFFILTTTLTKKFLKDESLKFAVSGNDLLNQNTGFSRQSYDNSNSQSDHTTIRRYALFSLIWDFNKMGGGIKPKN
ncbi:TonB-dependent receptor [Paradesertivirga mongoliensis]|uniref:TonB-dependent receptor n=1 Tax=Paradesertivirga mongoliensis TaxID=2100740 RepID=A0ABW4ZJC7_9SPHI|nr:TonB-dependent receptor [Pedobacter mongoliensis]